MYGKPCDILNRQQGLENGEGQSEGALTGALPVRISVRRQRCIEPSVCRYLQRDMDGAVLMYMEAAEYGYDVAESNLAYLYDRVSALQIRLYTLSA